MKDKALVLLSGGLDSSTCLAMAVKQYSNNNVMTLTILYGQRHRRELDAAIQVAKFYGIGIHLTLNFDFLFNVSDCVLIGNKGEIPHFNYADLEGISPMYVPYRNGTFLSIATVIALQNECTLVYFGAHSEDAQNWAYPDCTPEFIGAMANAIYVGTYHKVRLITPLQWMVKSEIAHYAHHHNVPISYTWSCYEGGDIHCGLCPTCRSRKEAFIKAGLHDPTDYKE